MKSKEEIEQLSDKAINKEGYTTDDFIIGFEQGYTQCQEDMADKKYTEEDLREAITFGQGMELWKEEKQIEDYINSLNKQD